ncbi:hypothetical protein CAC42_1782 [Sphaceloma murrayae]|uniref:Apple domain-containing protein n=1 Tax=Sphaceloma murrayae TaxID=2082308 RepID=A0A2K1QVG0_9PEZI|nr:hypothetical protein CAC42_1782 [Sphaceloma murrayae]
MRNFLALAAVAGLAMAQDTATLLTGPPMGVYKTANNKPAITATTLTEAVTTASGIRKRQATSVPTGPPMGIYKTANVQRALTAETLSVAATAVPAKVKRSGTHVKRDDVCVAQPTGIGYVTNPDDPNSFVKDQYYSNAADNAVTPSGYTQVFQDIVAANSADNYMGFTFLTTYDVSGCAAQCNSISGCTSFNIYFERDPVMAPDATACPNPPSLTRIKCVWWGGLVSLDNANNYGNLQADFYVAVAGSNGYENTDRAAKLRAATPTVAGATIATETATTSPNSVWIVYYSADSSTGAYSNAGASSSYTDCMTQCDSRTDGCKAFTYVGADGGAGSGTCWLKTSLGTPNSSGKNVITAVRVVDPNSGKSSTTTTTTAAASTTTATIAAVSTTTTTTSVAPVSSLASTVVNVVSSSSTAVTTTTTLYRPTYGTASSSVQTIETVTYSAAPTTAQPSSSLTSPPASSTTPKTTTTSTTTTSASPTPRYTSDMSCGQMAAVSSTFSDGTNAYVLSCSHDINGVGDIGSGSSSSFYGCFDGCAKFSGCQAFTYVSGVCYFKTLNNVKSQPAYAAGFNFAYIARYYTATTAVAASTTTTTATASVPTTTTTTPPPTTATTTTQASTTAITTTASIPTTLAVQVKYGASSTTSTASSTTTTSSTASATPTGFYISVGTSNSASNQYAYVNWWALGRVTFVSKSQATLFKIDSKGYLRNTSFISMLTNYIGLVDRLGGAWQKLGFRPLGVDPLKCRIQDGYVQCDGSAGFVFAGTCNNDGYLYMGTPAQMPRECGWTGLYPVSA